MDKVQGVSLPRCGHNLLVQHLQQYFGTFEVCPDYRKHLLPFVARAQTRRRSAQSGSSFHYCEYYYSCRTNPCCDAANSYQKSHDFDLDLPVDNGQKYLIQTRNDLGLLISWYELRLPRKREVDSAEGFIAFVQNKQPYLKNFRKKWVASELPNRLVVEYDDYLNRPAVILKQAIEFFAPDGEIALPSLQKIVGDVRPAKRNQDFRYYNAAVSTGYFQVEIEKKKRLAS